MKYYLLFIVLNLAIILAYADFDEKESLRIEKMQNHMRKIRGFMRKLESTDEDSDDDDSSDDDNSSDDDASNDIPPSNSTNDNPAIVTMPTTPKETGSKTASIQLIGFNSFQAPPEEPKITFRTYFTFINVRPPRFVIILIAINIRRRLRYLDDEIEREEANCTIDPEYADKEDGNVRYNCDAPKDTGANVTNVTVLNVDMVDPELKGEQINYSEEAALAASSLILQTKTIDRIFQLNNVKLTPYNPNYFIISGVVDTDDKDAFKNFGTNNLVVQVVDESTTPSTPYNVTCKAQNTDPENYQLRCDPETGVKGTLYLSTVTDQNNQALSLNITRGNDTIDFSENSTTTTGGGINRPEVYRKSSSGLSGGAIAGIVIACVVVLIIASIAAIMMKKSATTAPIQSQNPSIVGLRSVDNYSQ